MILIKIAAADESAPAGALEWIAASLPGSLELVADDADVRAVSGSAGWTDRAEQALEDGASGVVVVAPTAEAVDRLQTTAAQRDAFVILDQRWRSNPSVDGARDAVSNLDSPVSFAEIAVNVTTSDSIDRTVLEAVQIALHIVGALEHLRILHRQPHSVLLSATITGGAPLTISVAVGPAIGDPFQLRVVTGTGGVHAALPGPETAAPGLVTVLHADGATTRPTRWESAHRASWRRAIAAFESGARPDDLREFEEASRLLVGEAART